MDEEIKRQLEEGIKQLAERLGIANPILKNFGEAAKKGSAEFRKELDALSKEVKKGRATYADQLRKLEELNDVIEELTDTGADAAKKAKLLQQREELIRAAANQKMKEAATEFGKQIGVNATQTTAKFTRQLQANASGTELSSNVMNSAIDATASTLGYLGTKAQTAGAAFAMLPSMHSKILGMALMGSGAVLDFLSTSGKAAFKFANEILTQELVKTEKAFSMTTTAGAVFADGLQGMRTASVDAGLNLQQFSNVISKQSGDLALSGMGVAEGARKVGQVGKIFDANGGYLRKQMQRLGYGFEEQAEITATVMGNVKRAGQSMNSEQLAKETQKYMENLRLVSALTGEDAKAKAKANQDQNQIAAFQQELALMGPEMAAQIDLAMTGMTEIEKKNFRDRVVFHGAVLNEEGAIYEATNRAAATKGAELYNKFLNHAFDASAVVDANAKYRDQTLQSFKDNQAIFIGGYATNDATLQAVSAAYLEARVRDLKQTKEGVDKVQDDIKNAKIPTNDLTEGMIKASTAAQALSIRLEEKLLPLLSKYADMTGSMLTGLQNLIDMAYGKTKTPGPKVGPGPNDLTGLSDDRRTNSQKAKDDEDVRAGRKKYNSLGFDQPNVDPYEVGNRKGRALGGISTGPVSGYMELLHGTEAVVPLSDGRSIPVSLDSSSITAAVNQQSGILSEILRAMQNSNSLTSQIVQNSY